MEYNLLQNQGNARNCANVKFLMAVLMVTCGFVLLFFTYVAGVKDYTNSQNHSLAAGTDNTSTRQTLTGSIGTDVVAPAGDFQDAQTPKVDNSQIKNPWKGRTTGGSSKEESEKQGDESKKLDNLQVTTNDGPSKIGMFDLNGNTTLQDSTNIAKLTREVIVQLMNHLVDKIRRGHVNKKALEGNLLMIQRHLYKIDRIAKKKEQREHSKKDKGRNDKGTTSDHISKEVEEEQKTKPRTYDDTKIQEMLTTLRTSPSTLDRVDLSKHLAWDFACYPTDLVGGKNTQVCLDNSAYDREFFDNVTTEGTWQNKMLSVFVEYIKTRQTLQVLDIGAGFGVFSLAAAALNKFVLAVEPCRQYLLPFHKSVSQNRFRKRITLVRNALSSEYKLIQLINDPKGNPRNTKTVDLTEWVLTENIIDPHNVVRTVKLSDLERGLQYPGALMKIDINGDELEIFKSAEHFFEAGLVSSVLMEWHYDDSPNDYIYIGNFLKSKNFVPRFTVDGPTVSYTGITSNQPYIFWIKDVW